MYHEVQEMAQGIVFLGFPNELAWNLVVEGTNAVTIGEYHFSQLLEHFAL